MTTFNDYAVAQQVHPMATEPAEAGAYNGKLVEEMYLTLKGDRADVFDICHRYFQGDHLKPYAPRDANDQIKDLQERSITNWIPLLVNLPSQVSFVDGFRRGSFGTTKNEAGEKVAAGSVKRFSPEYEEWQKNGLTPDRPSSTVPLSPTATRLSASTTRMRRSSSLRCCLHATPSPTLTTR